MTYKLIILLIFTSSLKTFGQKSIEFFGGYCKNNFHDYMKDEGHYQSSYELGNNGYSVGIGIEKIQVDWLTMRFTLRYDKYDGEILASDGGLGGGYTTKANIDKSLLTLGLFPVNLKVVKAVDINIGLEISRLIHESISGTASGWLMGQPNWSEDLNDRYDRYNNLLYIGLKSRIAYDLKLRNDLYISPQYQIYYGISNEFEEFPEATKSIRHYFCIGIEKTINPKRTTRH